MSFWTDVVNEITLLAGGPPTGQEAVSSGVADSKGQIAALDSTAQDLFNGLSAGFEGVLSDVWSVIQGPIEIAIGVGIFIFAMVLLFQGQILSVAPLIAAMA